MIKIRTMSLIGTFLPQPRCLFTDAVEQLGNFNGIFLPTINLNRAGRTGAAYTFFSKSELMYLAELQIHLGRPLVSSGVVGDVSKVRFS